MHDWFGVVVGSGFQSGFGGGQSLWGDGPICFKELLHDVGDWPHEEAGVVVDEVLGEALWVDSSVDLLDDCTFNLVAHFERFRGVSMELSGSGDLGLCCACQIWKNRVLWSNEQGDSGGDAVIGAVAAD